MRWARRARILSADAGDIPSARTFTHRYSCQQFHPGLCITDDAAHYSDITLLATNIERALPADMKGTFLRLADVEKQIYRIVYFGSHRKRATFARQTHVFVECEAAIPAMLQVQAISLQHRPGPAYLFASVWTVAKHLIVDGCQAVHIHTGTRTWANIRSQCPSLTVSWAPEPHAQVFPGEFRRVPTAATTTDHRVAALDPNPRQPPSARPRTGGVRGTVGHPMKPLQVVISVSDNSDPGSDDDPPPQPQPPAPPPDAAPSGAAQPRPDAAPPAPSAGEGGVAPPPPPPPAGDVAARRRYQKPERFGLPSGSHIRYDAQQRVFGVHCKRHEGAHPPCKFDRSAAKGPLGLMIAWAELPDCTVDAHRSAAGLLPHAPAPGEAGPVPARRSRKPDEAILTRDRRQGWRDWATTNLPALVALEAAHRGGATDEPVGVS